MSAPNAFPKGWPRWPYKTTDGDGNYTDKVTTGMSPVVEHDYLVFRGRQLPLTIKPGKVTYFE
jgi:hypothetical protein